MLSLHFQVTAGFTVISSGKYFHHTIVWHLWVQLHWSDGVILDFHQSIKGKGKPVYSPGVTPWHGRSMQDSEADMPTL